MNQYEQIYKLEENIYASSHAMNFFFFNFFFIIASKTHTEKKQKLNRINNVIKRKNKNK